MPFLKSNFSIEEDKRVMEQESFEARALERLGGSFMVFKGDPKKKRKFLYFPEDDEE